MKQGKNNCDGKSCYLCQHCLPEWLPAIAGHKKTMQYKKGAVLFNEGDAVTGVYFVYSGIVKVHKQWGEKELILRFAKGGDVLGHRGLGKDMVYPIAATALEPVTVCFIDFDFFKTTLRVNYDFSFGLLMFLAEELQESEKKMRNLAHMQVKGRIAYALLQLQHKFGVTSEGLIDFIPSRQDLASYTGTAYETLFRIVNELVEENIIKLSGKSIAIVNMEKLVNCTKENNGAS
jgi:CRP/FNR family transcriptional regulator